MVGVTDSAFRQLAKDWGADVVYTEMISADALVHSARKALAMLDHERVEYPLVAQLMGNDPAVLANAARLAASRGVSGIDINFGCPAHKIARNECGVALMRDLDRCRRLISVVCDAVPLPVSIKVRTSIRAQHAHLQSERITIFDFLNKIADLPIAALMVHGRSFEDSFEGGIRSKVIAGVKEIFRNGPVIANGGITSIESSKDVLEQTKADGLGLARSVIGKPWVFRQIREYLATGSYVEMEWDGIKEAITQHVSMFDTYRGMRPFQEIRRHLTHYIRGHRNASEIRQQLVHANSALDVQSILTSY